MSIKISIAPEVPIEPETEEPKAPIQQVKPKTKSTISMRMNLRRALDGNIMCFDHKDIDIIISPTKMKIMAFTKGDFSDHVYATQNRLFEFLAKKGLIDHGSIKGGQVYGSFEASILKPVDDIQVDQIIILNIGKWIEEERPRMEFEKHYEEHFEEFLTDPEDEDSTELGEVPQEETKGSIPKNVRRYTGGIW